MVERSRAASICRMFPQGPTVVGISGAPRLAKPTWKRKRKEYR